jgi:hypothetical protein
MRLLVVLDVDVGGFVMVGACRSAATDTDLVTDEANQIEEGCVNLCV